MVESVSRSLRDGVLPGEFAPALMLLNHSSGPHSAHALLLHLLFSLSFSITTGTAQPGCIVLVAAERGTEFYCSFKGFTKEQLLRIRFVDCFIDPLGWREILGEKHTLEEVEEHIPYHIVCNDLFNLHSLLSLVLQAGTSEKAASMHFSVVIDSVSSLLAHNSVDSVAKFLTKLRANGKVSSIIWLLHSALHDAKAIRSLEYISSITISLEEIKTPVSKLPDESLQTTTKKSFSEGLLKLRQKRRNGRLREQIERFEVDGFSISTLNRTVGAEVAKIYAPKVQFRLQLSDKERGERAKVILPFEHQGNGSESLIYNGRLDVSASLVDLDMARKDLHALTVEDQKSGHVEYLRDSDDERPDSDEDPDDDLDI